MCVTHGMPCVTMHGLLKAYIKGVSKSVCVDGAARNQSVGAARRMRRKGGNEKRKGGKEMRKGGKGRKRKEEKRRRKGRKRGKRKECCAVSRPGR